MCCMMHVLSNLGQVVKNLCLDMVALSIVVQVFLESTMVNDEG